jgi:hypothetical protein
MEVSKPMTSCGLHEPRAAVFHLGDSCPLCEALEALLVAEVQPESRGARLVRESFRVSREAMQGGCWDGEG